MVNAETEALIRASIAADVLREASAVYWRRRAEQFEWAKPRLGEHHGDRGNDELSAAWRRCDATATACRNKAHLIQTGGASWDEPLEPAPTRLAS